MLTTYGYTPAQVRHDAVQAALAMSKSVKADDQRKADYYEGASDILTQTYARMAGIDLAEAMDHIASDLEALEA